MATVTKDFRIKSGLVVEGANGTINGSDILTEDAISGGTQNNITVTYNANSKTLDFSVDALAIDVSGPLTYSNNVLDVATGDGLEIVANALAVNIDTSLKFDNTGDLGIKLGGTFQSGLTFDNVDGGLRVNPGPGIELDGNNMVSVSPGSGITTFSNNVAVQLGTSDFGSSGLTFDSDGGVRVNPGTGITFSGQDGSLTTDPTGIVNQIAGAGLVSGAGVGEMDVNVDGTSIVINNDQLSVQTSNGYGLTTGAYGLEIDATSIAGNGLQSGNLSYILELADVANVVGTYGNATSIPTITVDGKGRITAVSESAISTSLGIAGDNANTTVSLGGQTLSIVGGEGIDVTLGANTTTLQIDGELATTNNIGMASFDEDNFTVTNGAVSSKAFGFGTGTINLGDNVTTVSGLLSLAVDNITIDGNEISSTNSDGNISLNPNGNGTVDVNSSRITSVATPTSANDAANKAYVDAVTEGLHIHASAKAATTTNIAISTALEAGDVLDNVTLVAGDRVLVKNQNTASENGIYVVQASGAAIRATDFDQPTEVDGGDFIFVTQGAINGSTGWVQTSDTVATIGTDPIYFTQFSGAGTYVAGNGLTLTGNEFEINDNVVVTHTDLDGYLNSSNGTTYVALTEYTDNAIAIGDGTATPTYLALDVNSVAKQVAAEVSAPSANTAVTAYQFDSTEYRAAKFLVKVAYGAHSEVSEVLLTLDSSDNIAITEYAVVSTNGSASTITADTDSGVIRLRVTPTNSSSTVKVYGTLLI